MRAVVGQHGVDCVGHGLDEGAWEVSCDASRSPLVQLHEGELGDSVDGNQQVKPALSSLNVGHVDVEVDERVGLELALSRRGRFNLGQSRDAMPLQAAVQ